MPCSGTCDKTVTWWLNHMAWDWHQGMMLCQLATSDSPHEFNVLRNRKKQLHFFSLLGSIFVGILYLLKSAIALQTKYWRKRATDAVMKDGKALIRSRCLEAGISKPEHQSTLQKALVVARIVCLEYPHRWRLIKQFGRNLSLHSLEEVSIIGDHGHTDEDETSVLGMITFNVCFCRRVCKNVLRFCTRRAESLKTSRLQGC